MFHFHRDKDRYGFTHRLTKVAEVGAVVGGLLYLGHHFSEGIGGALSSFAESEDRRVFDETTIAAANGLTKGMSTFESMMDEKFGDSELNKGISLIHDITTGMRTDVLQQKRATSFLSRLGKFTDTPDAIQNLNPHDYQEVLQGVIKSGRISNEANINEAIEFSSHDTVNEITKLLGSKGVTLNQDFLQDSTTKMREILRETRKVALTAKEQRSFSSGNNVKMITQALEHMQGVSRYNAKALDKFAGVDKAMKELDLKGLFQAVVDSENGHKELADKLDDYFNKSKYKVLTDFVNPNGTLHEH
ncbi:MAG: hypothetical protein KGI25_10055, partial [Thaumarchaeota archaeon]|nr:hypothetical protein [Nitrososphaerota archaeon]